MAYIKLRDISKSLNGRDVLSGLSLEIDKNMIFGILGPSGSGKTTLLRILCGLETPSSGRISINDESIFDSKKKINIPPERRNMAMVFQDFALWPHLTVEKHIDFVLRARKITESRRKSLIQEYLELLQMGGKADSYPGELSGGEKQRVAIIRALAQEPRILLLDEPFSNLDQILKDDFKKEIKSLQHRFKATILYVTHNYLDLIDMTDKIAVMQNGKIVQHGTTNEVYDNPKNEFVSKIFGGK